MQRRMIGANVQVAHADVRSVTTGAGSGAGAAAAAAVVVVAVVVATAPAVQTAGVGTGSGSDAAYYLALYQLDCVQDHRDLHLTEPQPRHYLCGGCSFAVYSQASPLWPCI